MAFGDEVDTLLFGQAADHADDQGGIGIRQAELTEQFFATQSFTGEMVG